MSLDPKVVFANHGQTSQMSDIVHALLGARFQLEGYAHSAPPNSADELAVAVTPDGIASVHIRYSEDRPMRGQREGVAMPTILEAVLIPWDQVKALRVRDMHKVGDGQLRLTYAIDTQYDGVVEVPSSDSAQNAVEYVRQVLGGRR